MKLDDMYLDIDKDTDEAYAIFAELSNAISKGRVKDEKAIKIMDYYLKHRSLTQKYKDFMVNVETQSSEHPYYTHKIPVTSSKATKSQKLPIGPTLKGKLSSKLPINMDVLEASMMLKKSPILKGKLKAPHASLDEKHIKDILTPSSKKELTERIVHAIHAIMSGQGLKRDDAIEYGKILTHLISHIVDPNEQFDNRDFDESIEIIKKIRDGKRTDGRPRRPRIREAIKKR